MAESGAKRLDDLENSAALSNPRVTPLRDRFTETGKEGTETLKPVDQPSKPEISPAVAQAKPSRFRRTILLAVGPLVVVVAGLFYLAGGRFVSTDNAYVKADKLSIATDVSGFVAEIDVREGQEVSEGQLLFRLDDEAYRIALSGAQAQLGAVRNEIATLRAAYNQNLAQIDQAKTDVTFFETQFQRQEDLLKRGVTTQAAYDQAHRDLDAARDRVLVNQRQAEAALAQLGGDINAPIESNPRYKQTLAQVDKAERDLRRTIIKSSTRGIVTNIDHLQVGAYLQAAQPAFNLVASGNVWVEANPKETDLTYLTVGDPATVTVDAYPGLVWRAVVTSISPAAGSEFSVLPAQNASGNWVKVVQRVPVRLRVEVPSDAPALRSGMSVNVDIDTGHERSFANLFDPLRHAIGL